MSEPSLLRGRPLRLDPNDPAIAPLWEDVATSSHRRIRMPAFSVILPPGQPLTTIADGVVWRLNAHAPFHSAELRGGEVMLWVKSEGFAGQWMPSSAFYDPRPDPRRPFTMDGGVLDNLEELANLEEMRSGKTAFTQAVLMAVAKIREELGGR